MEIYNKIIKPELVEEYYRHHYFYNLYLGVFKEVQ